MILHFLISLLTSSRKIVVHATPNATDALLESCANIRAMTRDVYAPALGETIQIGQQTNNFSISLSDELLLSIKMSRVSSFLFQVNFRLRHQGSLKTMRLAM